MTENLRIERGWIIVNGARQDDGAIKLGTGDEMRFSPFEAISQRHNAQISWSHILTASVQRLAFWRRWAARSAASTARFRPREQRGPSSRGCSNRTRTYVLGGRTSKAVAERR